MDTSPSRTPLLILICGSIVVLLSIGLRLNFGLFLKPMSAQFGWGRGIFALAIAIQNLLWGVFQPFAGAVADRWGAGRVVATGGILYAVGLYIMSVTTGPFGLYLGASFFIAMALSCHPSLLIADEPTTALDVTTEAEILDLMRGLQEESGMAIMYITHNLGVIAEMSDQVAVMYLGKIVEQSDVNDIFFNPLHPYTRALLRSIPQLDDAVASRDRQRRLQTIRGTVPDPYAVLKGCPFHPRCPEFMSSICEEVEPRAIEIKPGQFVRCHLYDS